MRLSSNVDLPNNFRPNDFLKFHSRDSLGVSERITPTSLKKGVLWSGSPACISFNFEAGKVIAQLSLDVEAHANNETKFESLVLHMLGLTQSTSVFENTYRNHQQIGTLIEKQHGLRVPQAASLFEALTWAITGQQISINAAISIRRKLIQHIGIIHSSGIACYPDAERLALLSETDFRKIGFSKNKADTLIAISNMVLDKRLPLDEWVITKPIDEITQKLLSVKGIGRWTVNYTLLRGLGWLDGSLHGDVVVRNKLSLLLGSNNQITEKEATLWLGQFSPWRALVAAHLWAMEN